MAATAAMAGPPPGLGPPRPENEAAASPSTAPRSPRPRKEHGNAEGAPENSGERGTKAGGAGHHHHHHPHHHHHHENQHHLQHAVPTGAPNLSNSVVAKRVMPAAAGKTYMPELLLMLSKSPLVQPPNDMPKLAEWYGDWEPYRAYQSRAGGGGMAHSPMGSFGKTDRYGRGASGMVGGAGAEEGEPWGYGPGFGKKERYKKGEEKLESVRNQDAAARRIPNTGKNPFGQVSAGGAFKPAGREFAPDSPGDKRGLAMGGRLGRDRDVPPHAVGQRNGREFGTQKDRRLRTNADDSLEGDDWEPVSRSPEHERRMRPGLVADSAADWRKAGMGGSERMTGRGQGKSDREGGRKTAFPAWLAEEGEPAWMASDSDGGSQSKGRSLEQMDDGDVDNVDTTGMDSIQAFKARMKEKERRERERTQGASAPAASTKASGPPPGLAQPKEAASGQKKLQEDPLSVQDPAAFDPSSAAASKDRNTQSTTSEPPGLPGRTSRFARFFDGKPQAAALAAQQKSVSSLSGPGQDGVDSPATPHRSLAAAEAASSPATQHGNMADVFRAMSLTREQQHQQDSQKGIKGPDAPPMRRDPSEADVQSMQKIMAMLSGGGKDHASNDGNNQARPPPPPGFDLSILQRHRPQAERESPMVRHESPGPSYHQQQNPSEPFSAPQDSHSPIHTHGDHLHPHQQGHSHSPQGDWQNPGPSFDQQRGPPGFAPPPPGIDPRMMAGPHPGSQGHLPHGLPPHVAMMLGGGGPGSMGPLPQGMGRPFPPPGMRPGGPLPPLPPHLQHQIAGLPPQAQQQLLARHFGGPQSPFAGGMPPPPPSMANQQGGGPPPMFDYASSPVSHYYGPGPGNLSHGQNGGPPGDRGNSGAGGGSQSDANSQGAAHLMALLGQGQNQGK